MNSDLVFDIGAHRGEDTAFYLKKGYKVVAVEADPEHAEFCRRSFAQQIADGLLTLLEGAVVCKERIAQGAVAFYKNLDVSVWGTTDPAWRKRNDRLGSRSVEIEVRSLDLGEVLRTYGVPYYMKIDVEGADRLCLEYLKGFAEAPKYLSLESDKTDFAQIEEELACLEALGYKRFRAVQQAKIPDRPFTGCDRFGRPLVHQFGAGASGPFGEDLDGSWINRQEILAEYRWIFRMYALFGNDSPCARKPHLRQLRNELAQELNLPLPGWYDTHAAL